MNFPSEKEMDHTQNMPIVTLRDYIQALIDGLDTSMRVKFSDQERAVQKAFDAVETQNQTHIGAHAREHQTTKEQLDRNTTALNDRMTERFVAMDMAQDKFEANVILRFSGVNEWREQSKDREAKFALAESLNKEADRLESLISRTDGDSEKRAETNATAIAAINLELIRMQGQLSELTQVAKDVRDLRDYQQNAIGKGLVTTVMVNAVVAVIISVIVGLILYVARGGG